MRRRPPFRRRRPPGRRPAKALQMLRRANRLMDTEQYAQAYPLLKRLADGAAQRDMPVRAANLYLRAARARLEMGSAPHALELAQRAIALLSQTPRIERIRYLLSLLIDELEQRGHHEQALALRAEMTALTGPQKNRQEPHRAPLPRKCPACGGPVRADQVDWIDAQSAECPYCGSTIQAQ